MSPQRSARLYCLALIIVGAIIIAGAALHVGGIDQAGGLVLGIVAVVIGLVILPVLNRKRK